MDIVKEFSITVGVLIRREPAPESDLEYFTDGYRYDWISDRGESDEFFTSIAEATSDALAVVGDR